LKVEGMEKPRIGVYICHCGTNIAATVDVEAVTEYASRLPGVVVARNYTYMCSEPGQTLIKEDAQAQGLNRVVVASCSPRMHEPTFRGAAHDGGVNPYRTEMANIREQCSWVHHDGAAATSKAKALVASAVAKAAQLEPLEERQASVIPGAVVIGGGVAGMIAALDVAEAGFPTFIVEQADHLGGRAAMLHRTFPDLEPVAEWMDDLVARVVGHPNMTVFLNAQVVEVEGYVGNFKVQVEGLKSGELELHDLDPKLYSLDVGAIIVATGYELFDPHRKPEFGYGVYPQVITTMEMERRLVAGNLEVDGKTPKRVAFIKCVGSRDVQLGNAYCSRVCCQVCAKQAQLVREALPDSEVNVFYIDVRTFGKRGEEAFDEARRSGVRYRRGNVSEVYRRGTGVALRFEDTLLRRTVELETDLVVLAVGMEPRPGADAISALLKLPRSGDGFFLEAHPKLGPVDTAMDGVFLAGCCQGPKDIPDTVAQAKAAASSALIPLLRGTVPVGSETALVDPELCAGCGMCVSVCPFGAAGMDELWGVSRVNAILCKGCGACAVTCPSKAIRLQHFTAEQVMAQVDALVE
ncbi:MAG: CoB--CoM heterodisulfide reductase iron-sulfur subunit A family protein, partial [Anaerolineae bacterium]|nr:CoB--CoM heterodisulfide reductase iron-sulfur subunit A family protein [Anaerolineae bacterium]